MRGVRGKGDQELSKTCRDPPETGPEGPVTGGSKKKKEEAGKLKMHTVLVPEWNPVGKEYSRSVA